MLLGILVSRLQSFDFNSTVIRRYQDLTLKDFFARKVVTHRTFCYKVDKILKLGSHQFKPKLIIKQN